MNLDLDTDQLNEVAASLKLKISAGLAADGQELACLPTYLQLPTGQQSGSALVVDTGGTNMRAALVELKPRDGSISRGPLSALVAGGRTGPALQAKDFFDAQANLCEPLAQDQSPLPLGYCFSYPAASQPDGDAVLVRWTKGIRVDGVVGTAVGQALQKSLQAHGFPTTKVRVLNDTVASLLGGVHLNSEARFGSNYIGLILGTGTNMAGMFGADLLTKVPDPAGMVVNLESGNFDPPFLSDFDKSLDEKSDNPGAQRFEKAVSGHYLPYLFDEVHPNIIKPEEGTKRLVQLREDGAEHGGTAAAILKRSAQLAAAALVAVADFSNPDHDVAIMGEGGLLWGDPQYAACLRTTLKELRPQRNIELVKQRENVNLLGAASAALT